MNFVTVSPGFYASNVSFPDEELNNIDPKDPNLLKNRPLIQRVIVISAGVFANLILAYIILILNVTTVGIPFDPEPGILVLDTQPDNAASLAGLKAGDKIIEVAANTLGIGDGGPEGDDVVFFNSAEEAAQATKKVMADSAWYKDYVWDRNHTGDGSRYNHFFINDLLGERRVITEQQYDDKNLTTPNNLSQ